MLSRTAASFFWIGRYTERAEYTARLANVHYHLLLESAEPGDHVSVWHQHLANTGELKLYEALYGDVRTRPVLEFLTLEQDNPNSTVNLISSARENARGIQDQLSSEVWHHINTFYLKLKDVAAEDLWRGPHELLRQVQDTCYTLHGVIGSTMLHDEGWSFYRLGKDIERASRTARLLSNRILLEATLEPTALSEFHQCIAILKSASAYEAYRKVYKSNLGPVTIVDFLLLGDRFPRSVHFCARAMRQVLQRLNDKPRGPEAREPERLVGQLAADLDFVSLEEVYDIGLETFLGEIVNRLDRIAAAISKTYFSIGLSIEPPPPESRRHRIPVVHSPIRQEMQGILSIRHTFTYRYASPVAGVRTLMRLAPNQRYGRQRLLDVRWHMDPPGDYRHYTDAFGNLVWQMEHDRIESEIACTVEMRVETRSSYVSDGGLAMQGTSPQDTDSIVEALEFTRLTTLVDRSEALMKLAQRIKERGGTETDMAERILHQVTAVVRYEPGVTHVGTTASEAVALGAGVCQDLSHVMLSLLRMLEIPSRYVSGYLPSEGQMHAWVEVLLPIGPDHSLVWVAYDPTHQRRCDERYVAVAVGRDYQDIAPTSGYYTGQATNSLTVAVSVTMDAHGPVGHGLGIAAPEQAPELTGEAQQQQQQ